MVGPLGRQGGRQAGIQAGRQAGRQGAGRQAGREGGIEGGIIFPSFPFSEHLPIQKFGFPPRAETRGGRGKSNLMWEMASEEGNGGREWEDEMGIRNKSGVLMNFKGIGE